MKEKKEHTERPSGNETFGVFRQCAVDETNRNIKPTSLHMFVFTVLLFIVYFLLCACMRVSFSTLIAGNVSVLCGAHPSCWTHLLNLFGKHSHTHTHTPSSECKMFLWISARANLLGTHTTDTLVNTPKSNAVPTNTNRNTTPEMLHTKWLRMRHTLATREPKLIER